MFSFWQEQMAHIQAFKVIKGVIEESGKPIIPLGFTLTQEVVELHVLEALSTSEEPIFMDFEKPQTHRSQMRLSQERNEAMPI